MLKRVMSFVLGFAVLASQCTLPASAEGNRAEAPTAIRLGDIPETHPAYIYNDGTALWWCANDLLDDYTVCEKAVVYPAGSFGL